MKQASADLRRQIDYLVWAILFLIGLRDPVLDGSI